MSLIDAVVIQWSPGHESPTAYTDTVFSSRRLRDATLV